jgi:hypothetical protein
MTVSIKPIETTYNGYRFRSRLEARWAVFFDAVNTKYEYEKEGYALPSGPYLPDFWLPEVECWVEIKPVAPTERERRLCAELAHGTDKAAVIVAGVPGEESLYAYCSDGNDSSGGTGWWGDGDGYGQPYWSLTLHGDFCICSGNDCGSRVFSSPECGSSFGMEIVRDCRHDAASKNLIRAAYLAARQARFEPARRRTFDIGVNHGPA